MKDRKAGWQAWGVLAAMALCTPAYAQDLVLSTPLDSGVYGTVQGNLLARQGCTIGAGKNVLLFASDTVVLTDGFTAVSGSTVVMRSGIFESISGATDSDGDGLADWQELVFFADLSHDPLEDADGDGVSNQVELMLGTDPAHPAMAPSAGWYLTYDARGRLQRAIRVSAP